MSTLNPKFQNDTDSIQPLLDKTGFLFQLKIEAEIKAHSERHGWIVASREHAYKNQETGKPVFIDLVLRFGFDGSQYLVLECKRYTDPKDQTLRWLFLVPEPDPKETFASTCYEVSGRHKPSDPSDPLSDEWRQVSDWDIVEILPKTYQSEFCVLPSDDSKKSPLLESMAAGLVDSVEGLGEEVMSIHRSQRFGNTLETMWSPIWVLPVLVTNAQLYVSHFDSKDININSGKISTQYAQSKIVPYVRFKKSLTFKTPSDTAFTGLAGLNSVRERTIFIVNAEHLVSFLTQFKLMPSNRLGNYSIHFLSEEIDFPFRT
jgi:hypothetical protein